jgi:sarcosine oxidase subunit beta
MSAPDIIVIGAGIHGCSLAMQLAMRGMKVLVLEKEYAARHASGVNAGSVHHIPRLTAELPLAELTLRMWHQIAELLDGDDCGFRQVGHTKIAETQSDVAPMQAISHGVAKHCTIREEYLDRDALRGREPQLARSCVAGIFSPECGYALPARTVDNFRRKAVRLGVEFRFDVEVTGIRRSGTNWYVATRKDNFEAPLLVNCAGAWGDRVARWANEEMSLTPLALMMSVTAPMPRVMNSVIGLTYRLLSIKQFENGTVVIGGGYRGTPDLETGLTRLSYARLGYNLRAATEVFPILRHARIVRCWAGIEGRSPDGLPIIGPSATEEGLWHAFGFSTHGFYLGPAVGHVLAETIVSGTSPVPIEAMHIARFRSPPHGEREAS